MRKWFVIAFVVLLLIYTGCAICVPLGLYGWDAYFEIVGVVGGLASIIGLGAAAFVRIVEVLVKKASLVLFYKEELNRLYEKLLGLIRKNNELNDIIVTIPEMERQLSKLEGEVDNNPEIRDILSTIQKAKTHRHAELVFNTLLGAISFKL